MKEKRKFERFDLELRAKVEVLAPNQGKEVLFLMTKNICEGGAFFPTPQPLSEETDVEAHLVLPLNRFKKIPKNSAHLRVKGTVLRSEPGGMAIRFQKGYKITL
jgi:hypothetical protein